MPLMIYKPLFKGAKRDDFERVEYNPITDTFIVGGIEDNTIHVSHITTLNFVLVHEDTLKAYTIEETRKYIDKCKPCTELMDMF